MYIYFRKIRHLAMHKFSPLFILVNFNKGLFGCLLILSSGLWMLSNIPRAPNSICRLEIHTSKEWNNLVSGNISTP